jgi:hypothetical protein
MVVGRSSGSGLVVVLGSSSGGGLVVVRRRSGGGGLVLEVRRSEDGEAVVSPAPAQRPPQRGGGLVTASALGAATARMESRRLQARRRRGWRGRSSDRPFFYFFSGVCLVCQALDARQLNFFVVHFQTSARQRPAAAVTHGCPSGTFCLSCV